MKRREFIITSMSVVGGIAIGGYYLTRPETISNPLSGILNQGQVAITPYVIVESSGVTIIAPRAEMGQGIHGTLAVLVAEELDISFKDVKVIPGPPSEVYANNVMYPIKDLKRRMYHRIKRRIGLENVNSGLYKHSTGAQSSIKDGYVKMRKAGAAARLVLIMAAARKFGLKSELLFTKNGEVVLPNGNTVPYSSLVDEAKGLQPPTDPVLKSKDQWTQLGQSQPRVDMISKCTGTAKYSIDIRLPGMLYATVRFNPHIGVGVKDFDDSKAKDMPGFIKAIASYDGIIVIATNTWYAMQAAKMIDVEWKPAPYPATSKEHRKVILEAFNNKRGVIKRNDGDVDNELAKSEIIEGTYHVPYLAHATMEPLNALAWLKNGQLDIWAGNQNPGKTQLISAQVAGISYDLVKVHSTYMGGGFGRRLEDDFIKVAVQAAMEMQGKPVMVTWSRESDMTHDVYRPLASAQFRGSVSNGKPIALELELSSPSLFSSSSRRQRHSNNNVPERVDRHSTTGAIDQPYKIKNYRVTSYPSQRLLPVGWFRGVGESQNVFFHDSAIDELAHAASADPLEMRLSLLEHKPSLAILRAVSEMSNWASSLPEGHARGVAYALSSGAATAQVIEISNTSDGNICIEKVFIAVDVGIALDPKNIEAQVHSSVIFGLCAAMHGEITVTNGKVDQTNFHNYKIMRMNQVPEIEVRIYESESSIYGAGECGTATAAPALGNAIFALTGKRIRELPFSKSVRFV